MWPPKDPSAIPSGIMLMETKLEIMKMEIELKDALSLLAQLQLRTERLKDDISQAKAWISPIRRISYDIISFIFQLCGEDDWRTTLAIAAVSKGWREMVIATPHAWSFISLNDRDNIQTAYLFLERSGQCPLHLYVPSSWSIIPFTGYFARIQCISLLVLPTQLCDLFPNLKWLSIRNHFSPLRLSDLSITRFPALKHLRTKTTFQEPIYSPNVSIPTIAALETLSIPITANPAKLQILYECKSTIVALRIDIKDPVTNLMHHLVLPNLESLEVCFRLRPTECGPVTLTAPKLRSYSEFGRGDQPIQFIQGHEATVRYVYTDHDLVISSFPLLHFLQLQQYTHAESVLAQLLRRPDACPHLELIEVVTDTDVPGILADTLMSLNTKASRRIRLLKLWPQVRNFPGSCASYMVRRNLEHSSILSPLSAHQTCHVQNRFRDET